MPRASQLSGAYKHVWELEKKNQIMKTKLYNWNVEMSTNVIITLGIQMQFYSTVTYMNYINFGSWSILIFEIICDRLSYKNVHEVYKGLWKTEISFEK